MDKKNIIQSFTDLNAIRDQLAIDMQRIIDVVTFGLLSSEEMKEKALTMPNTWVHTLPSANTRRDFQQTKEHFQQWILTGGFRENVECIHLFLDSIYEVCVVYWAHANSPMSSDTFNAKYIEGRKKFHRMGLPTKITELEKQFSITLRAKYTDEILTINKVRNCFVHRQGIVADPDINSPEGLTAMWYKIEILLGQNERPVTPPIHCEKEEQFKIRYQTSTKTFPLHSTVHFTAQEFNEICLTIMLFSHQLVENTAKYAKDIGIPFKKGSDFNP